MRPKIIITRNLAKIKTFQRYSENKLLQKYKKMRHKKLTTEPKQYKQQLNDFTHSKQLNDYSHQQLLTQKNQINYIQNITLLAMVCKRTLKFPCFQNDVILYDVSVRQRELGM